MEEITTNEERISFLTEAYDLSENNAKALLLAEIGYTHSGIASELNVTNSTARKYLKKLESQIGDGVTQTVPKDVRYATYPDSTPKSEVRYSGDVIDVSPEFKDRDLPVNKGVSLEDIPTNLIGGNPEVDV